MLMKLLKSRYPLIFDSEQTALVIDFLSVNGSNRGKCL